MWTYFGHTTALIPLRIVRGHGHSTFWALLLMTGASQLMGCSFAAVATDTISTRSCRRTTSKAPATSSPALATAASTHASTCSRSLAPRACSFSSRHFTYFLLPPLTLTPLFSPSNYDYLNCWSMPHYLDSLAGCLLKNVLNV
jgi:hypothetical protein